MTFKIINNKTKNSKIYKSGPAIDKNIISTHINTSLSSRLEGKNAATDMFVFASQNPYGGGNFPRNSSCWLNGVTNISCFSPAQLSGANWWQRGGTLISPRHILLAKHFTIALLSGGTPIIFVDDNGAVVTKKLVRYEFDITDIAIGLLDSDVPENIKFAKVLPPNYTTYLDIANQNLLYAVGIDQQEKAIVKRFNGLQNYIVNDGNGNSINIPNAIVSNLDSIDPLVSFTETIISGDSGNPVFLIIDNELVVLTTWWTAASGPFITTRYDTVNVLMSKLGGGYNLTPIDLNTVYNKYK
jgi:hypothetical protein